MRILTIGTSPYLLDSKGKMNADLLVGLKKMGHDVISAVWYLDTSWFCPTSDKIYNFEKNNNLICEIIPISLSVQKSTPQLYEIIKKVKPEIVISISDYNNISLIYAIKNLDSELFKWIFLCAADNGPINHTFHEAFGLIDMACSTTKKISKEIEKIKGEECLYTPYGPKSLFEYKEAEVFSKKLKIICCSKNVQQSNISSLIIASSYIKNEDFEIYIHTNHSDVGEIDLLSLSKRYGVEEKIKFPEKFVSLNDGIEEKDLCDIYNSSDVIADLSMGSSTSLCLLEGMRCGCMPLSLDTLSSSEILEKMPEKHKFTVRNVPFIAENEEEFFIADPEDIAIKIKNLIKIKNSKDYTKIKRICRDVAKDFANEKFIENFCSLVKEVKNKSGNLNIEIVS